MVRTAANDPARFGVAADKMRRLEKVLAPLGDKLFGQGLFMVSTEQVGTYEARM